MGYTLKLISEHIEHDTDYLIEEDEKGKKNYKIKGIFMQADIKNRNGRIYPLDVLQKEVKRYSKDYIKEKKELTFTFRKEIMYMNEFLQTGIFFPER